MRAARGSALYRGCCDVMLHFDQVRVSGAWNCRRVRMDRELRLYVLVGKRRVYLAGALEQEVMDNLQRVYNVG